MRFSLVPFEERILLDAAGVAQVVDSYALEHTSDYDHNQTTQVDSPGASQGNDDAVDGRVLVISSQVKDSSILAEAAKDNVTVITYDFNTSLSDLADSIADKLAGTQATSIGFALMGADGQFSVTSDVYVTFQNIDANVEFQSFWNTVGGMVQNGGSIDILACNVAGNTDGVALVAQLDALADNADADHYISVNASTDKTGSTDLGGNWMLEVGNVSALDRYFDNSRIQSWSGLLDSPVQLIEINPGSASSSPSNFIQTGTDNDFQVFFLATTASEGRELWVTDGTAAGTHLVKDINVGTTSTTITNMVQVNGDLYFIATVGAETSLWTSDGTSAGTIQVTDINASGNDAVSGLVASGSTLYFSATTAATGAELFRYSSGSVTLAYDANPGAGSSSPTQITVVTSSMVLFVGNNGVNGAELMRFGGSGNGLVADIRSGATGAGITSLMKLEVVNSVIFAANNGTSGIELWRSDGSTVVMIQDLQVGSGSSSPTSLYADEGSARVYFTATTSATGSELWGYNYSSGLGSATISLVSDVVAGAGSSNPVYLGSDYFAATTSSGGRELWVAGTLGSGTATQLDINPGSASSNPSNLVRGFGNSTILSGGANYYFTATSASGGTELWAVNGTSFTSAFARIADIFPGVTGSNPTSMISLSTEGLDSTFMERYLYFSATGSSASGAELWIMDMNTKPTAGNTSFSGTEDTQLSGNLLTNAIDPDLNNVFWGGVESLHAVLVTGPTKGSVSFNLSGGFTYTPNANTSGTDSFTYRIVDVWGEQSAVYTATLTIAGVNDAPVGLVKSYNATEDTTLTVNTTNGVVTGATDTENNTPITAQLVTTATKGTLTFNSNGSFTYVPFANQNGADSFTYRLRDSLGALSAPLTANITIAAVNDAPVAQSGTKTTAEDTPATGTAVATDVDNDTLTYSVVTGPANGVLNLNSSTGAYTYTPNANYNGADSFTFRVNDGTVNSNTATVNITNTAVNDAPVAQSGSNTTNEDVAVAGTVVATDVDSASVTYSVVTGPANGVLNFNTTTGAYTYTPAANYNGSDSFTFRATDGSVFSNTATVSLVVNPINDAPVANSGTVNVAQNGSVNGAVSFSDIDTPNGSITASLVTGPVNGVLNFNPDGTFSYTPDTNFNGTDSFTFKVNDGFLDSNTQTININVTFVNQPPTADPGSFVTDEDTPLSDTVTFNDVDTPAGSLTAILVSGPANGSLIFNSDGTFTYTPGADNNGSDSFTYKINDGQFDSNVATVNITITPVNDAPVALDVFEMINEDTTLIGTVATAASDVDFDPLSFNLIAGPSNGSLIFNNDGSYTFIPTADFNGSDSFTYNVTDGTLTSTTETVTITINPVNDAPTVQDDSVTTDEDVALSGTVATVAADVDFDTLTFSFDSGPTNGVLIFNSDGTYTYTPNTDFNGTDSFTYKANDGSIDSETKTVTITINPVNDAPVAQDIAVSINEDTVLSGTVVTSVTDVDVDTLTYSSVTGPVNGALIFNTDGTYTYTPNGNFNGTDSFTYKANDGQSDSQTRTVTIGVDPVNDAPVAQDGVISTNEGTLVSGSVSFNDIDVPADTLVASVVDLPLNGLLVFNPDGTYTYTPNGDFNGSDSFTYRVFDGTVYSGTQMITITVNPANDAPIALDDAITTNEDTLVSGSVTFNDIDVPADTLVASVVDLPINGSLVFNPDGTYTYTPNANYHGTDSFTYRVYDGASYSGTQTIAITVLPVNDAPEGQDASFVAVSDTPILGNAPWSDIDNDSVVISLVTGPANGSLVFNPDGSFQYTPNAGYVGTDFFTFVVNDGQVDSQVRQINVELTPVVSQVATPPPVPPTETPPVIVEVSPATPPTSSESSVIPPVDIPDSRPADVPALPENPVLVELGDRDINIITIPTRSVDDSELLNQVRDEPIIKQHEEKESVEVVNARVEQGSWTPRQVQTLENLALIPTAILESATVRGKTWDEDLDKILLLIGPVVDNIDLVAKQSLRGLLQTQSTPRFLSGDRRRVKKFTLISSLLAGLDLSFARESKNHIAREEMQKSQKSHLKTGTELAEFGEEYLERYVEFLQKICETEFSIDHFMAKEALAVELITKYIVAQTLQEGFKFPFPKLLRNGKESTIHYTLTRIFNLGNSEIPVYMFEGKERNSAPLLVFRGSRMRFDNKSDAFSIIENFNVNGPARGYYKEFEPTLASFFNYWFAQPEHKQKFRVFGYSQGGVLGQRAVIDFPEFMQQTASNHSIFFNSPGIEKDYFEKWNAIEPENRPLAVNYVITKDAVSKVGAGFIGEIYEIAPKHASKVTEAHFGVRFLEDDWKVYKVDNERESESTTRRILNAVQASVLTNGVYQLASKHVESMFKAQAGYAFRASKGVKVIDAEGYFPAAVSDPSARSSAPMMNGFDSYVDSAEMKGQEHDPLNYSEIDQEVLKNAAMTTSDQEIVGGILASTSIMGIASIDNPQALRGIHTHRRGFRHTEKGVYSPLDITAAAASIIFDLREFIPVNIESTADQILKAVKDEQEGEFWR